MIKYDISASIVIYKYSGKEIDEIIKIIDQTNLKILLVLVDNSPKSTKKYKHIDNVKYIYSNKNYGYGRGQNIALKFINGKSKLHMFLSSDLKLPKNFFVESYSFLQKYNKVDVFVPKILNYDGSLQYSIKFLPDPLDLILRIVPLNIGKLFINHKKYEIQKCFPEDQYMIIPYGSGSVVIFRNDKGPLQYLFDERFFLYMEDLDWFRKVGKSMISVYNPKIVVKHFHNAASKKFLKLFLIHLYSAIKYFNKNGWLIDQQRKKINKKFSVLGNDLDQLI